MTESRINRRLFGLIAGGVGVLAATGCNLRQTPKADSTTATAAATSGTMAGMAGMSNDQATPTGAAAPAKTVRQLADEMDAHHEAKMKLFPAQTEGRGNQPLAVGRVLPPPLRATADHGPDAPKLRAKAGPPSPD